MPVSPPILSQQTSGLGSYSRVIGATLISCPRTRIASSTRVYNFLKNRYGFQFALQYFNDASFGPYRFGPTQSRLIWAN
jgi:hypothetical protein